MSGRQCRFATILYGHVLVPAEPALNVTSIDLFASAFRTGYLRAEHHVISCISWVVSPRARPNASEQHRYPAAFCHGIREHPIEARSLRVDAWLIGSIRTKCLDQSMAVRVHSRG